jgi:hypothetical protein
MNYKAKIGQSIYDICLQTYGSLDHFINGESTLFKLIRENNIGSVNESGFAGKIFIFDASLIIDNSVYLKNIYIAGDDTKGSFDDSFDTSFD